MKGNTVSELHSRLLTDLAPPDIQEYLATDDTILMPMGACEMHGDHLPIGTDIYNAMEVSRRAAEKAGVLHAPPIWSGYSPHHLREPETRAWARSRCAARPCGRSSTTPPAR